MKDDWKCASKLQKRVLFLKWCVTYGEQTAKQMVREAKARCGNS